MLRDSPELRRRIFADILELAARGGGSIAAGDLGTYRVDGEPLRLVDPQGRGIRNPKDLDSTLSVRTTLGGSYEDGDYRNGVWEYHYQAASEEGDNSKLRRAWKTQAEIVYFDEVVRGRYMAICPVRVIADNRERRTFTLALDAFVTLGDPSDDSPIERAYRDATVRQRIHQPKFRARVLSAYATQCTVCNLRHVELLDAAHIVADKDDWGDAIVTNGMAMCKIHHAAYDRNLLGVTPDYGIRINEALLVEADGPMLQHGLKEMHGGTLSVPNRVADRPDRDRLAVRFDEFARA